MRGKQTLSDPLNPAQNFHRDSHNFLKKKSELFFIFSAPLFAHYLLHTYTTAAAHLKAPNNFNTLSLSMYSNQMKIKLFPFVENKVLYL